MIENIKFELVKSEEDQNLLKVVQKDFIDLYEGHSTFQIQNFILNNKDFPLTDDKYYQAIRETFVRFQTIVDLHFTYRKQLNEIKLLELDLGALSNKIKNQTRGYWLKQKLQIKLDMISDEILQKKMGLNFLIQHVSYILREMAVFKNCIDKYRTEKKYSDYESKEKEHWEKTLRDGNI